LWFVKNWARWLYTSATLGYIAATPFLPSTAASSLADMFDDASVLCSGGILVLLWFSSLAEEFAPKAQITTPQVASSALASDDLNYPNLLRRYLATLLDLFALWLIIYAIAQVSSITDNSVLAYSLLALTVLLYEPALTTYACTPGQVLMRIRVRSIDGLRRIHLHQAIGRMIVKYFLGLISFLTVPARNDRRAIHDLSSGTIVIGV
jgi:uncharacterized RDD family membrane protein YckC